MEIRPIHTQADYEAALAEVGRLWNATSEDDLQRLADWGELIDIYESRQIKPARGLDPVAVIQADMEMTGRTRADLAALIGQSRTTELLNRKRALNLQQIRLLVAEWGLPAELLIGAYETA